jgi:hypothetical protein
MELGRLDRLQAVHWPKAVSGDVPATNAVWQLCIEEQAI